MLRQVVDDIGRRAGAEAVALSFHDWETATSWSLRGERWFHAASTIKLAVLLAVNQAVAAGRFREEDWLHVRNRFPSRVEGTPFRVIRDRDADAAVHAEVGKLMRIGDLVERMIVASSNLATNLLLDLVGVHEARETLAALRLDGIDLVRGVEDEAAFAAGINNRVTADGLLALLRLLHDPDALAGESARAMVAVMGRQELTGAISLGLPPEVRAQAQVAHKTGEIRTVAHDAGLVFLPGRQPFALVVLSEWPAGSESRQAAMAKVVGAVFEHLVGEELPTAEEVLG